MSTSRFENVTQKIISFSSFTLCTYRPEPPNKKLSPGAPPGLQAPLEKMLQAGSQNARRLPFEQCFQLTAETFTINITH
jgi:hypothetical protein